MRKPHFKDSERNYGGGYGEVGNSESGALTVTARVSNGSSRYAMPSMPEFIYAALLYKDDNSPESPSHKDFVQGTETEDGKIIFSFQKPDDTSGTFTLEIFAFEKTSDENTPQFSKENALLSGKKDGLSINGDTIEIDGTIALAISSTEHGTVSLKIKVPDGCSLYISEANEDGTPIAESEARFIVTGDSPNFTVTQKDASGISAGAYQVKFTVKKKVGDSEEIVHIFSEYINVINGFCTDTWGGSEKGAAKEITPGMISSTVYVRGTGGWYDKTEPYKDTAMASDSNSGSFLSPLATIQKAIDKIIAINDVESKYTIYVDGTLNGTIAEHLGTGGMADFSALDENLTLTIKPLSGTATLDGGTVFNADGTVETAGIDKSIIYARPGTNGALNLTLENLTITGGNSSEGGGGIYVSGGTLDMKNCKVEGNITTSHRGGGIFVFGSGTVIMDGGTISRNKVGGASADDKNSGGGVYVSSGRFTMKGDAIISENILADATYRYGGNVYVSSGMFEMEGGTISGGNGTYGGGVYAYRSEFTMKGGEISGGNANSCGGGVYVASYGTFTMTGGIISGNNANSYGGGVYVDKGAFMMNGGTISENTATHGGGSIVFGTFTMSGGIISRNNASYGKGAYLYSTGKLNMSGTAQFAESDDVYIYVSGSNIPTITITGALTAATPVATITPSAYTANRQVLSAGDGVTLDGSLCNKFAVTPQADGTEWRVALDGADGVLIRKYEMGDTGPGGGAVCNYYSNGFTVNGKTCHYLECSKEILGTMTWCPCTSSGGFCELTLYDTIGQGYANTQAILSHPNHASATASNCAAKACAEYSTETTEKGEWFLPSQKEVLYIYRGISVASEEPLWMSQASSDGDNSKAGYIKVRSNDSTATSKSKNIVTGVRAVRAF